ncbi:sulfhydrogenase subunit delta [Inmirania thermothiophila]|uniref:Coenzyme F420-reducing hydrogenase gamma subunit n=1 Tax=Inmirania thermothiophila TaxID=1750597 RepID=A0A3N1Y1Q9_9GAMM|nr:sulfhydrogenase subunit delta [Inmirania thermothiophila]ROR32756.1 coenzyme F420-reducing hydrogenase gamma subunit [Inmirania thermothiophila]
MAAPRIAVHKLASCDGCQLALLNLGEDLLALAEAVEIRHFVEAGWVDEEAEVDIALVEGAVSTPHDAERIRAVRARSRLLVAVGACATAGGVQALRNEGDLDAWLGRVYPHPEWVEAAPRCEPLSAHVPVDLELPGCPVSGAQVVAALASLLRGAAPAPARDAVCMACKRAGHVCTLVAGGAPCMGPVTVTGCGAVCPGQGRDCYGCYGPAAQANTPALMRRFRALGLDAEAVARRFAGIQAGAEVFAKARYQALHDATLNRERLERRATAREEREGQG